MFCMQAFTLLTRQSPPRHLQSDPCEVGVGQLPTAEVPDVVPTLSFVFCKGKQGDHRWVGSSVLLGSNPNS